MDLKVSYYIHFADHLLKAKGEEVFRRVVQEGVDAYINNWKRKEAAEEKAYELKKQAEKLEALRVKITAETSREMPRKLTFPSINPKATIRKRTK